MMMWIEDCKTWSLFYFSLFQEFGDSARARKLYEQDSDDDDDEELEPNPKLEQGELNTWCIS